MGGSDSWDVTKYVNIWICNLLGSTAYTAPVGNFLPGDDGLVCHYNHIGNSHIYPYGSGRSIVHEMGHYFCLKHIWGDDGGLCSGTDYISDTPNQSNYSTNCPTFPGIDSCSPLSPGVMYMNFMDYSADECRNMFTAGQVAYMQSCISAILPALPNSTACSPVTSRAKTKREYSFGLFPNPGNGEFTIETDFLEYEISVRDMAGIQLFRKKINSSTFIWKEKLPPGIYFVSLSWETGKITRKIIVQ